MALERLPSSANPADVAAAIGRDGYAIVEQVVAPEVLDRARAELQPHLDATPFGPDDFAGRRTRRTGGLIARSATCRDIVMHPLVLGAVGQVLGHVTSFQLHLTQVIAIGPPSCLNDTRPTTSALRNPTTLVAMFQLSRVPTWRARPSPIGSWCEMSLTPAPIFPVMVSLPVAGL